MYLPVSDTRQKVCHSTDTGLPALDIHQSRASVDPFSKELLYNPY